MGTLEILAQLAISGWNSRTWTYQELCLAKGVVVAMKHGALLESSDSASLGRIFRFDLSSPGASVATGWSDLSIAELPTPLIFIELSDWIRRESMDAKKAETRDVRFITCWNALGCKSTTKQEDALGIFANLLDLSAAEVLALDDHNRMKAILKTFNRISLDILFANVDRHSANFGGPHAGYSDLDRWIPRLPRGLIRRGKYLDVRSHGLQLDLLSHGIWCTKDVNIPNDATDIAWAFCVVLRAVGMTGSSAAAVPIVQIRAQRCGTVPLCRTNTVELLLVFDAADPRSGDFPGEHFKLRRGACLITEETVVEDMRATYLCPFEWSYLTAAEVQQAQSAIHTAHELSHEQVKTMTIVSDIDTWPTLIMRRNTYRPPGRLKFDAKGYGWLVAMTVIIGSVVCGILQGVAQGKIAATVVFGLVTAVGGLLIFAYPIAWALSYAVTTFGVGNKTRIENWLSMQTHTAVDNFHEPRWRRLRQVLPNPLARLRSASDMVVLSWLWTLVLFMATYDFAISTIQGRRRVRHSAKSHTSQECSFLPLQDLDECGNVNSR